MGVFVRVVCMAPHITLFWVRLRGEKDSLLCSVRYFLTSRRVGICVLPSTCLIHPFGVSDNRIAPPTTLCALRNCFVQCARHPSLD